MLDLEKRRQALTGRRLLDEEARSLTRKLPVPAGWLLDLMRDYPLIGTKFQLSCEQDLSGLGVKMEWMAPHDIIGESLEFYPGIAAISLNYVAIGTCLEGSGDPYFVKVLEEDPPLVRIPHNYLNVDLSLSESRVEIVRPRLSDFILVAQIL